MKPVVLPQHRLPTSPEAQSPLAGDTARAREAQDGSARLLKALARYYVKRGKVEWREWL